MRQILMTVVVAAASVLAMPAIADVTMATSNAPATGENVDLAEFFAAERAAYATAKGDIAEDARPEPRPTLAYTDEYVDQLPFEAEGEAWECLTEALYFEARGEPVRGQFAVAEVILNRVSSDFFPDDVCAVVNQGTGKRYQCQFTYTCDGKPETIRDMDAYQQVGKIAKVMLDGAPRKLTEGATYYHTKAVNPRWARVFPRTAEIGYHVFYKAKDRRG